MMDKPVAEHEEKEHDLAVAAQALRADYEMDLDLTAFTAIDGDEFHSTERQEFKQGCTGYPG